MLDPDILESLIDTVRRFVRERLIPLEDRVATENKVPDEVVDEMRELGLFGLSIPEQYGGLGLNMTEEVLLIQEMGYTSPAFRSVFGTNVGIGSQGIMIDGTDEQKQKYLPDLASGKLIGSFALTEPDSGSDAASLRTKAVRDGSDYVLNGTKRYITNAPYAGLFTVMARTGSNDSGASGVTAFLVERDTPGIEFGPPDKKMGQQGALTCDVVFNDARVPANSVIGGEEGRGFKTAMKVLDRGRLNIGAACVGTARRLIDESVNYAKDRKQFGQAIANFQLVQAMLADSETEYLAGKSMVETVSASFDQGQKVTMEASCCKYYCSEMVGRVADRAVQIHGGAGYIADYCVERFYRDVRLYRLYEGTSQIQQLVIAKNLLAKAD